MQSRLEDRFGRVHDDLRVSVTDRCNLRCGYCMPEEPVWFPSGEILSFEEIARLVRIATSCGVRKVRLTGGEPLLRRDLPKLVRMLAETEAVEDLSLTTNGVLLRRLAPELAAAGLRRVNVSLDTLREDRFLTMTRRDLLAQTLDGLAAAREAGLGPIKINTVLMRDVNDDEVESLVAHAREHDYEVRFIECMPLGNDRSWNAERVVSGAELRARIAARWPIAADDGDDPHAPARRFRFVDGGGAVGFIDSVHAPFCASCTRLRLTSDGKLRLCLYDDREVDLKTPLRAGCDDDELRRTMVEAVMHKGPGGALQILEQQRSIPLERTMHQIGG